MHRRVILVAALTLGTIGLFFAWFRLSNLSLCRNLSCIEFAGKETYRLEELYTESSGVYRALFTKGTNRVRIEATRVPAEQSRPQLAASVTRMKSLFEKAPAPYPGEITNAIICDPSFVPTYHSREIPGGTLHYFMGYLNSRLTFGSCSREEAVYRAISAFMYCPKSSLLIRVELIAPIADVQKNESAFTSQASSLQCRS